MVVWDFVEDDVVDYNALGNENAYCYDVGNSPNLTPSNDLRISCGLRAKAIATDGVSYQLARLKAADRGRACFSVLKDVINHEGTDDDYYGSFSDPLFGLPGEGPATNVETTFQAQSSNGPIPYFWALGTYTPPTDFFTRADPPKVKVEVQFIPDAPRANITAKTIELTIRRPPVLLVHGIWSSAKTWDTRFAQPEPANGRKVDANFSYPNDIPFSSTGATMLIKHRIEELIKAARLEDELAVTRVDTITHSMGTLRVRRWVTDDIYLAPTNFFKGSVRKIAALTAPHLGSPLANMLINVHRNFRDPGTGAHSPGLLQLERGLRSIGGGLHNGAVCQLADNNPALVSPAIDGIRGSSFAATGGSQNDWAFLIDLSLAGLFGPQNKGVHIDPYFFDSANDKIVDLESQIGGWRIGETFTDKAHISLPGAVVGVTGSPRVADTIYASLDRNVGWTNGPSPRTVNANGVIPRHGGRGTDAGGFIDHQNYLDQCGPSGSMSVFGQ